MTRRLVGLLARGALALAVTLGTCPAVAQVSDANKAEARQQFKAGALAFKMRKFSMAVSHFEAAYELDPHPAVLFSAAQALKQQYADKRDPAMAQKARSYYERYVKEAPDGNRVNDANEAILQIDALLQQQGTAPIGEQPAVAPAAAATTGGFNLDTNVEGAVVSIDGGKPEPLPYLKEGIKPGKYKLEASAEGHTTVTLLVEVTAGRAVVRTLELQPKPAVVAVSALEGASIVVDGRVIGTAPMLAPIELPAGTHRIGIGANGHDLVIEDLKLARGEKRELNVDMNNTPQRTTSFVFFSVAGGEAAVGVVLLIAAAVEGSRAVDIATGAGLAEGLLGNVTDPERVQVLNADQRREYNDHINKRDNLRIAAAGIFGLSAASLGVGGLLYGLDQPKLHLVGTAPPDDAPKEEPKSEPPAMELSGGVVPYPGGAGLGLAGRF